MKSGQGELEGEAGVAPAVWEAKAGAVSTGTDGVYGGDRHAQQQGEPVPPVKARGPQWRRRWRQRWPGVGVAWRSSPKRADGGEFAGEGRILLHLVA